MSLNERQITILMEAVSSYSYPGVTYDFQRQIEVSYGSMRDVEGTIRADLQSGHPTRVKDGLSNVLYWGYATQPGRQVKRVKRFRAEVTASHLETVARVLQVLQGAGLTTIKQIGMPEFSNVSFLSKVRMFLDPENWVVLDLKLMDLARVKPVTVFHSITRCPTYIPCSRNNEQQYAEWSKLCREAAHRYCRSQSIFAVDVERGVYHLVTHERHALAAEILANI
jgi:hypothetical protein